jgi:hypothetical protein
MSWAPLSSSFDSMNSLKEYDSSFAKTTVSLAEPISAFYERRKELCEEHIVLRGALDITY